MPSGRTRGPVDIQDYAAQAAVGAVTPARLTRDQGAVQVCVARWLCAALARGARRRVANHRDRPTVAPTSITYVQTINRRQSEESYVDILCAADTAHAKSQRAEAVQAVVAVLLAAGSLVATADASLTPWVAIAGFAWLAIVELVFSRYSRQWTSRATLLQERFDRDLFNLPWENDLGNRPTDGEVARLAAKYSRSRALKIDWYVDVKDLPQPYAILICQRENLVWDEYNRDRWSSFLIRVCAVWTILGIGFGLTLEWTTFELLTRWFTPSSAALWYGVRTARKHQEIATTKRKLALSVSDKLAELSPGTLDNSAEHLLLAYCEKIQRAIMKQRDHAERVPQIMYRKNRSIDELHARADARQLRIRLLDDPE